MMKYLTFIILLLAATSCRDQGRPVVRPQLPQDDIHYLCSNADVIAVVNIKNGSDWEEGKYPKGKLPQKVEATVSRIFKGSLKEKDIVAFSNLPVMLPPGTSRIELTLYNGNHLVFLVEQEDHFALLTDRSLLHETDGVVTPIWRREPGDEVRHKVVPFEEAVADVIKTLNE